MASRVGPAPGRPPLSEGAESQPAPRNDAGEGEKTGASKGRRTGLQPFGCFNMRRPEAKVVPVEQKTGVREEDWKYLNDFASRKMELRRLNTVISLLGFGVNTSFRLPEAICILNTVGYLVTYDSLQLLLRDAGRSVHGKGPEARIGIDDLRVAYLRRIDDKEGHGEELDEYILAQAFKVFDMDGNGVLRMNELLATLDALMGEGEALITPHEAAVFAHIIAAGDQNRDDALDYHEFTSAISAHGPFDVISKYFPHLSGVAVPAPGNRDSAKLATGAPVPVQRTLDRGMSRTIGKIFRKLSSRMRADSVASSSQGRASARGDSRRDDAPTPMSSRAPPTARHAAQASVSHPSRRPSNAPPSAAGSTRAAPPALTEIMPARRSAPREASAGAPDAVDVERSASSSSVLDMLVVPCPTPQLSSAPPPPVRGKSKWLKAKRSGASQDFMRRSSRSLLDLGIGKGGYGPTSSMPGDGDLGARRSELGGRSSDLGGWASSLGGRASDLGQGSMAGAAEDERGALDHIPEGEGEESTGASQQRASQGRESVGEGGTRGRAASRLGGGLPAAGSSFISAELGAGKRRSSRKGDLAAHGSAADLAGGSTRGGRGEAAEADSPAPAAGTSTSEADNRGAGQRPSVRKSGSRRDGEMGRVGSRLSIMLQKGPSWLQALVSPTTAAAAAVDAEAALMHEGGDDGRAAVGGVRRQAEGEGMELGQTPEEVEEFAALLMLRLERERHLRAKEVANAWKRQQSIASAMRKASMGRKADAGQGSFRKLKSLLSIRASSRSRLQGPSEAQFRIAAQFLDTVAVKEINIERDPPSRTSTMSRIRAGAASFLARRSSRGPSSGRQDAPASFSGERPTASPPRNMPQASGPMDAVRRAAREGMRSKPPSAGSLVVPRDVQGVSAAAAFRRAVSHRVASDAADLPDAARGAQAPLGAMPPRSGSRVAGPDATHATSLVAGPRAPRAAPSSLSLTAAVPVPPAPLPHGRRLDPIASKSLAAPVADCPSGSEVPVAPTSRSLFSQSDPRPGGVLRGVSSIALRPTPSVRPSPAAEVDAGEAGPGSAPRVSDSSSQQTEEQAGVEGEREGADCRSPRVQGEVAARLAKVSQPGRMLEGVDTIPRDEQTPAC